MFNAHFPAMVKKRLIKHHDEMEETTDKIRQSFKKIDKERNTKSIHFKNIRHIRVEPMQNHIQEFLWYIFRALCTNVCQTNQFIITLELTFI